jgi:hypothetical protein
MFTASKYVDENLTAFYVTLTK